VYRQAIFFALRSGAARLTLPRRRRYRVSRHNKETLMKAWIYALAFAAMATAPAVRAQDANTARSLAASCATCHGTDGRSAGGVPPSLAGQDRQVLLQALRDFRDGKRTATIMHQQAKGYTDAQFELLASYFAAVKP
jgi:cytochrome subunit of sulfide dehydrogenase